MANMKELGPNIRAYRRDIRMTQKELSERINVSTQAISCWEQGLTYPDLENLCNLSEALSVSIDRLLSPRPPQTETHMIGIDGGGTKSEFVLFNSDGTVLRTFRLSGTNASTKGLQEALSTFQRGIDMCLEVCPTVSCIFIGNAGGHLEKLRKKLSQIYGGIRIRVDSDAVNALMSTDNADAAMIMGTGSILIRPEGDSYRFVGGWGFKVGDPGSAYNFGREACRLYLAYRDGMDPDPLIYRLVKEWLTKEGISGTGQLTQARMGELAGVIFEADSLGDPRAEAVIEREMEALAEQVNATCPEGGQIVAVGGIIDHYANRLLPVLQRKVLPGIRFFVPPLPPVYGACRACLRFFEITSADDFSARFEETYRAAIQ